ncbi:FG-GAP repeat protein [candidate division KSB1 bacterium]|nr:FG-GAP repeat protein [candidate division KSB1 bacterium]
MKKRVVFCLFLIFWSLASAQLREWVLQPFIEVKGPHSRAELGRFVYGFPNPDTNIPFNVVAGKLWALGMYSIHSKADSIPLDYYLGSNMVHGDFNGDGFVDVAIHQDIEYRGDTVFVYLGKSTGLSNVPSVILPGERVSEDISSSFGEHMCVGDLNNDGFDDLIIADWSYISKNFWGKIYIFMGGNEFSSKYNYSILGYPYSGLGLACSSGDLNDDGYDDLCLFGFDTNEPNMSGKQFSYISIYLGSADFDTNQDYYVKGSDYSAWGKILCMDANGDDIQDLLWSTNNPDKRRHGPALKQAVLVFNGGKDFDLKYDFIIPHPDTGWSQVGNFGDVLANAGDMNGDGYDDILIGAPYSFYSSGMMFVYCGGPALDTFFDAAKGQLVEGFFGCSLAGVGDVNGDGLSDIIVGASTYDWDYMFGYFVILLGDRRIPSDVLPEYEFPEPPPPPPPPPPEAYALQQNYPNPFNGYTKIAYDLPEKAFVRINITDVLGRRVRTIVYGEQEPGTHVCGWDGRNQGGKEVTGGVYFYKMEAGDYVQVKSMTLVR